MPVIDRTDVNGLIPVGYVSEIIEAAQATSMALSTFRRVNLGSKISNLPVLDALPSAYWVTGEVDDTGDGGWKRTTQATWANKVLTAEEIATIVIVPEAVVEDAGGNRLWDALLPRLAEAIGRALDKACFVGGGPASFPTGGIVGGATTATNVITQASPTADHFNQLISLVEADGYQVRRMYAAMSTKGTLRGLTANGVPIYLTDIRGDDVVSSIYGVPITFDENGVFPPANVKAVAGDSQLAILGVRTDMTLKFLDQAVIDTSDAQDGSAMVNLAQQDAVGYRIRARFAFQVANPVTSANPTAATRYPFSVLKTA